MKNLSKKLLVFIGRYLIKALILVCIVNAIVTGVIKVKEYIDDYFSIFSYVTPQIKINRIEIMKKRYSYNDVVPDEIVISDMKNIANQYQIDTVKWEKVLRCEATCTKEDSKKYGCVAGEINTLAKNPISTALGACQYLIGTWQETDSFKNNRLSRTDHVACLTEMAIDIKLGEQWRWDECLKKTGVSF